MVSPQLDVQIIDTIVFVITSYLYNMDNIINSIVVKMNWDNVCEVYLVRTK